MSNVCLAVIYNHQFVNNVEKIEKLYGNRFDKIYHVMPFYRGDNPDIISVYENSYQFQAYVSQALNRIYDDKFDYYVFMADDVLLCPEFSKDTMEDILKINPITSFTARNLRVMCDEYILTRIWLFPSLIEYLYSENKRRIDAILPDIGTMSAKYKTLGLKCPLISENKLKFIQDFAPANRYNNFFYNYDFDNDKMDYKKLLENYKDKEGEPVKYLFPFACGFSDFFVIPKKFIKDFAYYSGVLASVRIFAEVAIPTALCIVSDKINFPKTIGLDAINYSAIDERRNELPDKYEHSVKRLIDEWEDKNLLIHPVKYSMWEMDID